MVAVFKKSLRDTRRMTFWLAFGLGLYALFIMWFYPAIRDQSEEFDKLLKSYPREMLTMIYGGDVEEISISEPGTFIQSEFAIWTVLILGAIVIGQAFNAFTNPERDGTMDMLLSLPIARRSYLLGRVAGTTVMLLIVLAVIVLTFWVCTFIWPEFDVSLGRLALGISGAFFPLMVVAMFTYLLVTIVPSSRRFAGPIAYLFLIGSYLLYSFSLAVRQLSDLKPIFLFHYYNAGQIIRKGVEIENWLLLGGVALVYLALAWWAVDRKELGV